MKGSATDWWRGHGRDISFAAGAAGIALLLFAYYSRTWHDLSGFQTAIDTCDQPFCDFATFYYPMGQAILHTGLPIEGFVYSPFIAILLAVFVPLGIDAALLLWGLLQAVSIVLYVYLFRRLVPAGLGVQLLFVALALSSFSMLHTLSWGQVSIFTTVALLTMLLLLEHHHRAAAAAAFAFAVSFKFFPLMFLAPFVFRRDVRFLLFAGAACIAFLLVVPALFLGAGNTFRFYQALLASYRASDWVVSNYNSQHFPHVILRLTGAMGFSMQAYLPALYWIGYAAAAANLGLLFLIQRARFPHADLWSFHLLFLSIPFVLKTSWPVDLVYMPFAQGLLAWRLLTAQEVEAPVEAAGKRSQTGAWTKRITAQRAVAAILLLLSIVMSNILFFNQLGDRTGYGSTAVTFWANLLLLLASYILLLPASWKPLSRRLPLEQARDIS